MRNIDNDDQLVFIHLPKTAGTTLRYMIEPHFSESDICPLNNRGELEGVNCKYFDQFPYIRGHLPYELMEKMVTGKRSWITMLRNPIERYLSQFYFQQAKPDTIPVLYTQATEDDIQTFCNLTLDDFVNTPSFKFHLQSRDVQARWLATTINVDSPDEWIHAFNESLTRETDINIDLGIQRLDGFDLIGLTERFQDSVFMLSYFFAWPPVISADQLNATAEKPRLDNISQDVVDRIAELNTSDLLIYEHAKQVFEKRFTQMTHELLEQYGQKRHAHIKLPLSPEHMFELLEKHYVRCRAEHYHLKHSFHFTFDHSVMGNSWYGVEEHSQYGKYRWTGPNRRSTIDVPLVIDAERYRVEFSVVAAITPETMSSFKLWADEELVALERTYNQFGQAIFYGIIQPSRHPEKKPYIRLTFEVEKSIAPITLNATNKDERPVGLALDRLDLYPSEEEGWFLQESTDGKAYQKLMKTYEKTRDWALSLESNLQNKKKEILELKKILDTKKNNNI
jgi:hypothetical protein